MKECLSSSNTKAYDPFNSLIYSIIELAVLDIKALQEYGLIIDGQPVATWPTTICKPKGRAPYVKNKRFLTSYYKKTSQVAELLWFIKSHHLDVLLDEVRIDLAPDLIRNELKVA